MMTDRELWFNTYKLHVEQDPELKFNYTLDGRRVPLVDWAMDRAHRTVAEAPKEPAVEAPAPVTSPIVEQKEAVVQPSNIRKTPTVNPMDVIMEGMNLQEVRYMKLLTKYLVLEVERNEILASAKAAMAEMKKHGANAYGILEAAVAKIKKPRRGSPEGTNEEPLIEDEEIALIRKQRDALLVALSEATEQLTNMNVSASHAASWVEPKSCATTLRVKQNRELIARIATEGL